MPFYDDIKTSDTLPPFAKKIGMVEICRWGGVGEELARTHIDKDYARKLGYPDVDIQGHLKAGLLGAFLTNWLADAGTLHRMACQYRGRDYCGDTLTAGGKVTATRESGGKRLVDLEIWLENQRGERNTTGAATVALPKRLP